MLPRGVPSFILYGLAGMGVGALVVGLMGPVAAWVVVFSLLMAGLLFVLGYYATQWLRNNV